MSALVSELCEASWQIFRVSGRDITGPSRLQNIFRARAAVCLVANIAGHSYSAIGRALGERDKTTIGNAISRAQEIAARDPEFKSACERLRAIVKARPQAKELPGLLLAA